MALKKVTKKRVVKKAVAKSSTAKASARKRTVKKRVAKKAVRAAAPAPVSPVAMFEKELAASQSKLGKACASAVIQCEKEVAKLKTQLEKAQARQTLQKERKAAASKSMSDKPTQAAKTRVARANEAMQATGVVIKDIRNAMQQARSAHAAAKQAQKKFAAMEKLLAGFERNWEKAAAKPRKTVRRVRKPAAPAVQESAAS